MRFARWVFLLGGVYGVVAITPLYALEDTIARRTAPLTHPEYFYGFVGLCLVWHMLLLVIARDPLRWRPAMPLAVLEKLSFSLPMVALYAGGRVGAAILTVAGLDFVWAVLFALAFLKTRRRVNSLNA